MKIFLLLFYRYEFKTNIDFVKDKKEADHHKAEMK